eukprot:TRINITY_DN7673_c0_g1_i2.p1 TRINITY_DN7673_c0_g1~~TRINITY_DN7673_c0_g1_i2.p1  ORF type:complete len:262 (+),score=36.53 TRINITY_DN7673_c0_g1_i2:46-831(+)
MSLTVCTRLPDGTVVSSEVYTETTVNNLKSDVAEQAGLDPKRFCLVFEGKELSESKKLFSYAITGDTELIAEYKEAPVADIKTLVAGDSWWSSSFVELTEDPIIVTYEIRTERETDEAVSAFSYTKKPYGHPDADALTWYGSPSRMDFTFRGKVFGSFPNCSYADPVLLQLGKWHRYEVRISRSSCVYFIDDRKIAEMCPQDTPDCPLKGYFGFVTYASGFQFRDHKIYLPEGLPQNGDYVLVEENVRPVEEKKKGCCCIL